LKQKKEVKRIEKAKKKTFSKQNQEKIRMFHLLRIKPKKSKRKEEKDREMENI